MLSVKDVEISDVSVYVVDGKVVVVGAEHYTIVSIDGRILSPESQLPAGIYYVVVNGRTYPVFAK